MTTRQKTFCLALLLALLLPTQGWAQGASSLAQDARDETAADRAETRVDDEDEKDDKAWSVGASAMVDLGIGAFVKNEYARRVRSRLAISIFGSYTIPVVDIDLSLSTGFSQWLTRAGGSNGVYEFRWADTDLGLARELWSLKAAPHEFKINAELNATIPSSRVSWSSKLYTTLSPKLNLSYKLAKFGVSYSVSYHHSFHKYTSHSFKATEVDILSRHSGNEILGDNVIAIDGVLTQMELINQFRFSYQFIPELSLNIGLAFSDAWTYDNGTITQEDEYVSPNAKVGRGHSQYSSGSISLNYRPIDMLSLSFGMVSTQPWKTADNLTLRFPWFDSISYAKNYTRFFLSARFTY